MDLYRVLSASNQSYDCCCDRHIKDLFRLACPELPVDAEVFDLAELMELEQKIFFPKEKVRAFIDDDLIKSITECSCTRCAPSLPKSGERDNLRRQVHENQESASLIIANLIYLRETRMLYEISKSTDLSGGIDAVEISNHGVFAKNFKQTKPLFRPRILKLGDTECRYESGWRLPFINEKPCDKGSFGIVTQFEIHEDYIDKKVRTLVESYMCNEGETIHPGQKLLFARKTIRGARNQSLKEEVNLERDVLGVIAAQDSKHKKYLIDLIAFYTFGDEINLVFPYVEGNLERLLFGEWTPTIGEDEEFPNDWISRGMRGLAEGLKTIHNPPRQPLLDTKGKIVGFHFDLKPANILITRNGTFKITDFGQALIKLVRVGESTSGGVSHLGGDPRYAPPEDMPTRNQVSRSSHSYISRGDTRSSSARSELLIPPGSSRHSPSTPLQHLEIPSRNRQSQASSQSAALPQGALGSAKYDIWSLACVMLEVLTYLCLEGPEAVKGFRAKLSQSDVHGAFHTGQGFPSDLKDCVKEQLRSLSKGPSTVAPSSISSQTYMTATVELMGRMLEISEDKRPDAETVACDLDLAVTNYNDTSQSANDCLVDAIRYYDARKLGDEFYEVGVDDTKASFLGIEHISMQDLRTNPAFRKCRIKIYANKPARDNQIKPEICILVAIENVDKVDTELFRCPLEETYFSPLYLYASSDRSWQYCCRLKTTKFDVILWFESNMAALLNFQAILFQHVVERDNLAPESPQEGRYERLSNTIPPPKKVTFTTGDDYKKIELRPVAAQIWTTRRRTAAAPHRGSQGASSSTTSSDQRNTRVRVMLFLRPEEEPKTRKRYHVLHFALEPRLGTIMESATSLNFVPNEPDKTNGVFAASLLEVCQTSQKAPMLSLDRELYSRRIFPAMGQATKGIKLEFDTSSATKTIETIRRHFETANESNKPKITWIKPSRPRSGRRPLRDG